jgi:hypothetical protein
VWLDIKLFVFLQQSCLDARGNLVGYVLDMSATFARANRINEAYLLKLTVA